MKCFSYMQPWASLIWLLEKRVETRSRNYTVLAGRWHAVHASSTWKRDQRQLLDTEPFKSRLAHHGITAGMATDRDLSRGAIIGVAFCSWIRPTIDVSISDTERAFGNYAAGRWAYGLGQFFGLVRPVRFTARLGVFDLPAPVEHEVLIGLQGNADLPAELTSDALLDEALARAEAADAKAAEVEALLARVAGGGAARDTRSPIERMIDKAVGRG